MSIRKGKMPTSTTNGSTPVNDVDAFDNFRRRFVRQNKDIIIENAMRRNTIKALQDEIGSLQVELLEVRQQNMQLQAQVRHLSLRASGLQSKDTRRALDQILSAMPALQQLRHSLDTTSNPRETMTELENIWQMRDLPPNLVATRPAATLAEQLVLDTLEEDSEAASQLDQADIGLAQDGGVKIKQRRRTDVGSKATRSPQSQSFSPLPAQRAHKAPSPFAGLLPPDGGTPGSFPRSPSLRKQVRRRRESGLLESSNEPSSSPTKIRSRHDQPDALQTVKVDVDVKRTTDPAPTPSATSARPPNATAGPSRRGAGTSFAQTISHPADNVELRSRNPRSDQAMMSPNSLGSSPRSVLMEQDENARGRRVRRSVNYKEPSLTKKMRKPDGTSAEDTLRLSIGPMSLDSMVMSSFLDPSQNRQYPTQSSAQPAGFRRKSALPRSGIRATEHVLSDEEEEDVEEELQLMEDREMSPVELPDTRVQLSAESVSSSAPPPRKTPPRTATVFRASTARVATRTSPRKPKTIAQPTASGSGSSPAPRRTSAATSGTRRPEPFRPTASRSSSSEVTRRADLSQHFKPVASAGSSRSAGRRTSSAV